MSNSWLHLKHKKHNDDKGILCCKNNNHPLSQEREKDTEFFESQMHSKMQSQVAGFRKCSAPTRDATTTQFRKSENDGATIQTTVTLCRTKWWRDGEKQAQLEAHRISSFQKNEARCQPLNPRKSEVKILEREKVESAFVERQVTVCVNDSSCQK